MSLVLRQYVKKTCKNRSQGVGNAAKFQVWQPPSLTFSDRIRRTHAGYSLICVLIRLDSELTDPGALCYAEEHASILVIVNTPDVDWLLQCYSWPTRGVCMRKKEYQGQIGAGKHTYCPVAALHADETSFSRAEHLQCLIP